MSAGGLMRGALLSGGRLCAASTPAAVSSSLVPIQQRRTVVHKSCLNLNPETTPPPWDYKKNGYNHFNIMYDWTKKRFNQNTKLITVEGNIGSGKSSFAKELAEELGMYHMPEFKMDDILIDRYGNDMRNFYKYFPERFRYPDMKMFYANPGHPMTTCMQDRIYFCRYEQYANALAHMLNTGQGVVLERTPHSDFVFVNAMRKKNFIGLPFMRYYYLRRKITLERLNLHPHLIIYLDTPVDKCLENIKSRGNNYEVSSGVIDRDYLQTIEDSYKDFMQEAERKSYTLVYDWQKAGDTDSVVEDIEQLDLDFYERYMSRGGMGGGEHEKLQAWHDIDLEGAYAWNFWRVYFTEKYQLCAKVESLPKHEVEELYCSPEDFDQFVAAMKVHVLKSPHSHGYVGKKGDGLTGNSLFLMRQGQQMPDSWYDYYYKEFYYEDYFSFRDATDRTGQQTYNPDYLHH